ncbi:MAG: hypothetical protein ACOYOU_01175 [Kiritimatiellia bacterium]
MTNTITCTVAVVHRWIHELFLKLHNLSNRQDAKVAKTNKFDVSACGATTSGKLGVLGVLAVKNAAYVVLQEKTMPPDHLCFFLLYKLAWQTTIQSLF